MGWRFRWVMDVEHDGEPMGDHWPRLVRWAVVGLAVLGVVAVVVVRLVTR